MSQGIRPKIECVMSVLVSRFEVKRFDKCWEGYKVLPVLAFSCPVSQTVGCYMGSFLLSLEFIKPFDDINDTWFPERHLTI